MDIFRKKWKEDKGYCSVFDKITDYKQAVQDHRIRSRHGSISVGKLNGSTLTFRELLLQSQSLKRQKRNLSAGGSMDGCSLKGKPATFYNPVQNNMGENLQVFIE